MSKSDRTIVDNADRGVHFSTKQQQQLEKTLQQEAKRWSDIGHEAIGAERWDLVHAILDAKLISKVDLSERALRRYERKAERAREPFYPVAIKQFLKRRNGAAAVSITPGVDPGDITLQNVTADIEDRPVEPEILCPAFRSVFVALGLAGVINTEATSKAPAYEYCHQVGERYYSPTSSGSHEVEMIDPDDDIKATLLTGGQGSGKSTALETLIEDRIARGHKVIDLIDFMKVENAMYDVPSQSSALREARKEMGLPTGFGSYPEQTDLDETAQQFGWLFDEFGYQPPDVEVIAPLTPSLAEREIPVNQSTGEPLIRPFVVPACDLSYRQLVMVLPHTTATQENYLQSAHQMLTKQDDDWTLADMATCVREDTNAGDSVADRIERSLETVQEKSFIRDRQTRDEFVLDWDDLMRDTSTVTTFTMSTLRESSEKKLIASYLIDRLYASRQKLLDNYALHEYPPLTVAMRELHKVVPRSTSEQEAESQMEKYMKGTMSDLIALVRHADIELICDTQKFAKQIDSDVAELFNRILVFGGQKPDIKKVFRTRVDNTRPAESVAGYNNGKCALVSGDGYTLPIQMAPPRCHHLDARTDGNGLGFRTRHPDLNEEMEPAPWDASVPSRLQFDDIPDSPVAGFWRAHVTETSDGNDLVLKDDITEAYQKWSDLHDEPARGHKELHSWIKQNINVGSGQTRKHDYEPTMKSCYKGIKLTF